MDYKIARYLPSDKNVENVEIDAYKELVACLEHLVHTFPPNNLRTSSGGLFFGPTSMAFFFYKLQNVLDTTIHIKGYPIHHWTNAYFQAALKYEPSSHPPSKRSCGVANDTLCLLALGSVMTKDTDLVKQLCDYSSIILDGQSELEWLYGASGYLYLLRFVEAHLSVFDSGKGFISKLIQETCEKVISTILDIPRPWFWHGKAYVGAVHGYIGIITQIVLTDTSISPKLENDLKSVLELQYTDSGNWPSSILSSASSSLSSSDSKDKLVQVCHGSPGVVISLKSIQKYFPNLQSHIDKAIQKGQACIRKRGLLTKEPCLCHGISGNSLALDSPEFENFLSYTTLNQIQHMQSSGLYQRSDHPESLFCGQAGRAWTWLIAYKNFEKTLLGYNDI